MMVKGKKMYSNGRLYDELPNNTGGEFFIWLFAAMVIITVILNILEWIREKNENNRYLSTLEDRGYQLELFQSREGRWGWLLTYKIGKKIESLNLASHKSSPYTEIYHLNSDEAESEALSVISELGFKKSEIIDFGKRY